MKKHYLKTLCLIATLTVSGHIYGENITDNHTNTDCFLRAKKPLCTENNVCVCYDKECLHVWVKMEGEDIQPTFIDAVIQDVKNTEKKHAHFRKTKDGLILVKDEIACINTQKGTVYSNQYHKRDGIVELYEFDLFTSLISRKRDLTLNHKHKAALVKYLSKSKKPISRISEKDIADYNEKIWQGFQKKYNVQIKTAQ